MEHGIETDLLFVPCFHISKPAFEWQLLAAWLEGTPGAPFNLQFRTNVDTALLSASNSVSMLIHCRGLVHQAHVTNMPSFTNSCTRVITKACDATAMHSQAYSALTLPYSTPLYHREYSVCAEKKAILIW